jgi:hypothetical protein
MIDITVFFKFQHAARAWLEFVSQRKGQAVVSIES